MKNCIKTYLPPRAQVRGTKYNVHRRLSHLYGNPSKEFWAAHNNMIRAKRANIVRLGSKLY